MTAKPALQRFGENSSPVVVIDGFSGVAPALIEDASATPLPRSSGNHYPGLRRVIGEGEPAHARVETLLENAAPFIGGAFDLDSFDLMEASFSMVTTSPDRLTQPQRAPHFDSVDPKHIAVMLYLSDTPGTGTAFFRQRATGIETVDATNLQRFIAAAKAAPAAGYIQGSDAHYEEIGRVEARPDRLVMYRGSLLHSGVIPPDMPLSADPRRGRLTLNIFIQGQ